MSTTKYCIRSDEINKLLKERKITKKQLSKEIGFSAAFVCKCLKEGQMAAEALERIADVLDIPSAFLVIKYNYPKSTLPDEVQDACGLYLFKDPVDASLELPHDRNWYHIIKYASDGGYLDDVAIYKGGYWDDGNENQNIISVVAWERTPEVINTCGMPIDNEEGCLRLAEDVLSQWSDQYTQAVIDLMKHTTTDNKRHVARLEYEYPGWLLPEGAASKDKVLKSIWIKANKAIEEEDNEKSRTVQESRQERELHRTDADLRRSGAYQRGRRNGDLRLLKRGASGWVAHKKPARNRRGAVRYALKGADVHSRKIWNLRQRVVLSEMA